MKELVKPEEVEFSKMIDDSIKKATEGLKNLPNAITETEEITCTTTIDSEGKKTTKNEIKKVQKINPDATSNIVYNVNNIGTVNRQFL